MRKKKDPDERIEFGRHWGDWGGVVMALIFLIALIGLLFGPNPLEGLDKTDQVLNRVEQENIAKAEEARRQQAIHDAEASGVVEVGVGPAKKKPQ